MKFALIMTLVAVMLQVAASRHLRASGKRSILPRDAYYGGFSQDIQWNDDYKDLLKYAVEFNFNSFLRKCSTWQDNDIKTCMFMFKVIRGVKDYISPREFNFY